MAGSLNCPRTRERFLLLYCGDTCGGRHVSRLIIIILITITVRVMSHVSGRETGGGKWSMHWQEIGFRIGTRGPPRPALSATTGFCRVSMATGPLQEELQGLQRALTECNHVFLFLFYFFGSSDFVLSLFTMVCIFVCNSLWCLKLLFIPLYYKM